MNERLTIQDLTDLLAAKHSMTKKDAEAFVKEFLKNELSLAEGVKLPLIQGLEWKYATFPFAPIAILRPISLVLSFTETYIMFIIPIPPTIREILAIATKSTVNISLVELNVEIISC